MLGLIGYEGDSVSDALKTYADRVGLKAVRVTNPAAWTTTISVPGGDDVAMISPSGERLTCAVNRGLPSSSSLTEGENNDVLAAWWAGLAMMSGPVVNRPDATGFIPSPIVQSTILTTDVRQYASSLPGAVTANVHDAVSGTFQYRVGAQEHTVFAPVASVTRFDPSRTWRLMIAGHELIDVSVPTAGLLSGERRSAAAALRRMQACGLVFALVVFSRIGETLDIVAINPLPTLSHYGRQQERVHSSLLKWLRP